MNRKRVHELLTDDDYFDDVAAQKVIEFSRRFCSHTKGEWQGRPFELEEWQREEIIKPVFGIKRKADGLRRFSRIYIEIPRKNGKSSIASVMGLAILCVDQEPGAEIVSAATDKYQAGIVHRDAKQMVRQNETLGDLLDVFQYSIVHPRFNSSYMPVSSDSDNKHGFNLHGFIYDEYHTAQNDELFDVLTTSTGARRQPLEIIITTAGNDRNSPCFQMHEYARQVNEGILDDPSFLGIIYAAEDSEDIKWDDLEVWKTANPNFGISLKPQYALKKIREAKNNPSKIPALKQLHLNIWSTTGGSWISDDDWLECGGDVMTADQLVDRVAWGGLDLSSVSDITALSLYFPRTEDGAPAVIKLFCWLPAETADERTEKRQVNYLKWVDAGYIKTTPGRSMDQRIIKSDIIDICAKFNVENIECDRWNASQLARELEESNINVSWFGQGFKDMNAPTKELERQVIAKEINHENNPVLRWMINNVTLRTDPAGNIKPDKSKSREKIDGAVASVMAIGGWMTDDDGDDNQSIYNSREIIVIPPKKNEK